MELVTTMVWTFKIGGGDITKPLPRVARRNFM